MVSIAISLFLYKKTKKLARLLIFLALVGGSSRVFVGVHYPFDIIGSIFTETLGALFIFT